ncbi:MAG: TfoX/Sxy family DNA transformation protein, partial [Clostridiaceae bacterium]
MGELRELPNIGTTLEIRLKRVGIATAEDLIA